MAQPYRLSIPARMPRDFKLRLHPVMRVCVKELGSCEELGSGLLILIVVKGVMIIVFAVDRNLLYGPALTD